MLRLIRFFISPGRLTLIATIFAAAYFTFAAGNNVIHAYRLNGDETHMRENVARLRDQQEQLLQIRDYLRTDEYVEFMARRIFGLVKPSENLVVVIAPEPPAAEEAPDLTWWQRLFSR